MIKVFYDGQCGLCSKEIRHYQAIAPENTFEWLDITALSQSQLAQERLNRVEGLKHLHAKDHEGKLHIGVDAFILIWRALKRWRFLAAIVSTPGLYALTRIAYRWFAAWRFKRLSHCQIAANDHKLPASANPKPNIKRSKDVV
jgi:predicted DCC family thiol-disulfide oxidoreductase YuxK